MKLRIRQANRTGLGFVLSGLLFEFAISFEDANFLVQLFDLLFEAFDCIVRVISRQTVRGHCLTADHCCCGCPSMLFHFLFLFITPGQASIAAQE